MTKLHTLPTRGVPGHVPVDVPEPGQWPCQTTARRAPERLVAFLYRLLRDGAAAPGDVENHAIQAAKASTEYDSVDYTNPHLEAYARSLATSLIGPGLPILRNPPRAGLGE